MFVSGDAYSTRVKELFATEQPLDVAIAFWGTGAEAKAVSKAGSARRIICNLGSGGTNPDVIEKLGESPRVSVKKLDNLHAKVVIGKDVAIVGSANFSANGLGLEDGELAYWQEAGYIVTDKAELKRLRTWFTSLWDSEASTITPLDIKNAREAWALRRKMRPKLRAANDAFVITKDNWLGFRDRQIHVIVWGRFPTKAENARAQQDRKERADESADSSDKAKVRSGLDYYHNWGNDIHRHKHAQFIDVHWMSKAKRFDCRGARTWIKDGHSVQGGEAMDVLEIVRHLGDMRFSGVEAKAFTEFMNTMPKVWGDKQLKKNDSSFVISLDDVLEARFGTPDAGKSNVHEGDDELDPANATLLEACRHLVTPDGQSARWIRMQRPEIRTGYETAADKRLSAVVCLFRILADKPGRECQVLTYMSARESRRFGKSEPTPKNPDRTLLTLPLADLMRDLPEIHDRATRAFLKRSPKYSDIRR
ncbi:MULTISPECIES: phospholipase D-like domain-containing protein [Rhodanobacteraceae]|uniref:phospholipase D family protein n=1 Tax=Rhodanobacteraceae TaxID=1775411 RepID=UPI000891FE55|nr:MULTISPECIES: phospholipase D-like domain-containing protein [Rhodanobacteraceae]SDF96860.1 PLD-like domain-containing protein [Dyella sp. 333MFSha]SKB32865.1 Phosphatidylserine/phosphatidylglycerophosphate/cardiolipin synthases and related enzymes [Luteibacter sp. 22Crub2.1]